VVLDEGWKLRHSQAWVVQLRCQDMAIPGGNPIVKRLIVFVLLGFLSACSGLTTKSSELDVGSSQDDVLRIMGTAPYPSTQDGVTAWVYAARVALGYCDYREFFLYKGKVIHINQYYHSSIAGCTVGLQKIDWATALAKVGAPK
jgi:hypothetical protein